MLIKGFIEENNIPDEDDLPEKRLLWMNRIVEPFLIMIGKLNKFKSVCINKVLIRITSVVVVIVAATRTIV